MSDVWRHRLVLALPLIVFAIVGQAASNTTSQILTVERPEAEVLLLAVKLDQSILSEALPAYQIRGDVLVPLGELSRLLDLGITIDAAGGLASGFVISDRRMFFLDVSSGKIIVEGKPRRFDASVIEVHLDDIYVGAALLSEWLPLRLDVNLYQAMITVRPLEPLPLQLRLERESKFGRLRANPGASSSLFPRTKLPYRLFDGPFIDQTLGFTRTPQPEGGSSNSFLYTTYATGDLLLMEANTFVSGTEQGLTDARLSLGRKDPEGGLLGFFGAREVTVGDVFNPGIDLITLPRSGPGILISNYPLLAPTQFDRQTFRGDLPPGWDVELYCNGTLVAYAQSRADGLFEFTDVPLLFGMNVFRLELYGPQGQRRSETRILNVGQTLTPRGKVYYRLVGNNPGARLVGTDQAGAKTRTNVEVSVGLAKHVSALASIATLDLRDGRHEYGRAGLRAFWGFLFANADFVADRKGGSAWQGTLQSRIGGFGIQLQHSELRDFSSELFLSQAGSLRSRTALRLDAAIPRTFLPRIPVLVEVRQDQLASGKRVTQIQSRLSMYHRGLSISNQTFWSLSSDRATPSTASGQLLVSQLVRSFSVRGEIGYDLRPTFDVASVALTAEARLRRGIVLSTGINRALRNGQTTVFAGASMIEGAIGWTARVESSSPGGVGGSLLVAVGIGRDTRNGAWHTQARSIAASGAVSAMAFLDTNGNGVKETDEAPIPEAGFLVNGAGNLARTNAKGVAFIPNIGAYQDLDFSLATSTLEDPFWKSTVEGVKITPRPGKVAILDFPVVISGEITGTVYVRRNGSSRELGNVEIQLVDQQGAVVKRLNSAYDGFYDFTMVSPRRYQVRLVPEQIAKLGLILPSPKDVTVTAEGTISDNVDFVLEPEVNPPFIEVQTAPPSETKVANDQIQAPNTNPVVTDELVIPLEAEQRKTTRTLPSPAQPANQPTPPAPISAGVSPEKPTPICSVQIASYRERQNAVADAEERTIELHQPSRVVEVELANEGRWYRVLLGRFASEAEARDLRTQLASVNKLQVGPVSCESTDGSPQTATPVTSTPASQSPIYAIQLAAYRDRQGAVNFAALMTSWLGHPSHVAEVRLGPGGTWYRVLVGDFNSARDAASFRTYLVNDKKLEVGPILLLPPHS